MAATTGESGGQPRTRWHVLLGPRWLGWHAFVVAATVGMFFLGAWQLHRAESGNQLSWAYTFEWPLFAAFTVYFWIRSVREELHGRGAAASAESGSAATAVQATGSTASAQGTTAPVSPQPASWDATSWDATSWRAAGGDAGADEKGTPVDVARATPADGAAYLARLMAEVQGPGRRRGRR